MANTLSTHTLRQKYFQSSLAEQLRTALVCEKICQVDRSEFKTVERPYITNQVAAIQAVAGTYSPSAMTTTDDTLTVTDEVTFGTHVFKFEMLTANFDPMADFLDSIASSVLDGVDKFVLNNLTEDATGAYTTPAGGFTTAANVPVILANLLSKVKGYRGVSDGYFLVLENTDLVGLIQTQIGSGFNYADAALRNGMIGNLMGVDIYVVRSGTFVSATLGSTTVTNSGHRVFGVKGVSMYGSPRGISYEEKGVSGKTGKEISATALVGFKLWTPNADLVVDITLA